MKKVSFDGFIVCVEEYPVLAHTIRDFRGNNALAIYAHKARAIDEDGEPFRGTVVFPCTITYSLPKPKAKKV